MVIDCTHKPWAIATIGTIVLCGVLFVPYSMSRPEGVSGGSAAGLTYGISASLLMVIAGLLGARRKVPGWRIGRMQFWMRAHLWLGSLALPLVFLHGGFSMGHATLTRILMALLILVSVSGWAGAVIQHFVPKVMTRQLPLETIYEQIDHVREQLREECEQLLAAAEKTVAATAPAAVAAKAGATAAPAALAPPEADSAIPTLRAFYDLEIHRLLAGTQAPDMLSDRVAARGTFLSLRTLCPPALHETVAALEEIWEEARELNRQESFITFFTGGSWSTSRSPTRCWRLPSSTPSRR